MRKSGSDTVPSDENANPRDPISANTTMEETNANPCDPVPANTAMEETNANDVLSEDSFNLASKNIIIEDRNADNLLSEKSFHHRCLASSNIALEETNAENILGKESSNLAPANMTLEEGNTNNILSAENSNHCHPASANIAMCEPYVNDSLGKEIYHDYYRFAYNLVEMVLKIRKELNPNVEPNLPEPSNYLFTEEHASIVKCLLEQDTTNYLQTINELVNSVYDFERYMICRDFFVRVWKRTAYTEKSFICACASIAYVAAHFIQMNYHCGALDNAILFIASWVEDIFQRGTIGQSSW